MIDTEKVKAIAEAKLAEMRAAALECSKVEESEESADEASAADLYVVDCTCNTQNEVELLLDSDSKVSLDDCITLSRAVEAEFDRDVEDFQLTVASAGIGSEIKLLRQYPKLIGRSVEVLLKSGVKVIGELKEATEAGVKVGYEKREMVEMPSGKKKKQMVDVEESYAFGDIKFVKEYLDFK